MEIEEEIAVVASRSKSWRTLLWVPAKCLGPILTAWSPELGRAHQEIVDAVSSDGLPLPSDHAAMVAAFAELGPECDEYGALVEETAWTTTVFYAHGLVTTVVAPVSRVELRGPERGRVTQVAGDLEVLISLADHDGHFTSGVELDLLRRRARGDSPELVARHERRWLAFANAEAEAGR